MAFTPSRWRRIALAALGIVGALIVGAGSAWWAVRANSLTPRVSVGAWDVNLLAGSTAADPYTRARIALSGLLALDRSETFYFVAGHDDTGRPLSSACDYKITGRSPPTRWWSITAYGADYFLIPNAAHRYSVSMTTARPNRDGTFSFVASSKPQPEPWLPTGEATHFYLNLRLYNPSPELAAHPESLGTPLIEPIGACP